MAGFCISGFPIQSSNPPPPPPPPQTPATAIIGTWAAGNNGGGGPGNIAVNFAAPGSSTLAANDWAIAFIVGYHSISGTDITDFTGGLPAGWTMLRNDVNPGTGSLHGQMYCGIAVHKVTAGEAPSPTYTFSLTGAGGVQCSGTVSIAIARGSTLGLIKSGVAAVPNSTTGKLSAPAVTAAASNNLIFICGMFGTAGGGESITSDNGLPIAIQAFNSDAIPYYGNASGPIAPAQPMTSSNTNDAFTCYQVVLDGH